LGIWKRKKGNACGAKSQFSRMRGYTMQIGKGIIGTQLEFASVQENYSIRQLTGR